MYVTTLCTTASCSFGSHHKHCNVPQFPLYSTAKFWDETMAKFTVLKCMPTYSKHAAILCYVRNLKLHHIKQILVLKILCHQHLHTYTLYLFLLLLYKKSTSQLSLSSTNLSQHSLVTFLPGLIKVAYVLVVLAPREKFTFYLSCFQKPGKHISCLFIITYTAFLIFHLYAPRAHF